MSQRERCSSKRPDGTSRYPDRRGANGGSAKLTSQQVTSIRNLYAKGAYSQHDLAQIFGVTQTAIWLITSRRTWQNQDQEDA